MAEEKIDVKVEGGADHTKKGCCPPGAHGYLKIDAEPVGELVEVNYYKTGKGTKCLVIFPDVWGWNSGRVRILADSFAKELDCVAVVPKIQKKFREGTDDDGLPPKFDIAKEQKEFFGWALSKPMQWAQIQPMVEAMMVQLKGQGYTKFACAGFCWGGWAAFKFCELFPGKVSAIGIAHPSIHMEGAHGGDNVKLAEKIDCPVLLMPADGDDPKLYDEKDGTFMKVLKAKTFGAQCKSTLNGKAHEFSGMAHGWMTRGDDKDEKIAASVKKGFGMLADHFKANGFGREASNTGCLPAHPASPARTDGCTIL